MAPAFLLAKGGGSSASATIQTKADSTPPDFSTIPSPLITPTNGMSTANHRPPFRWHKPVEAESGVVSYTLRITSSDNSLALSGADITIMAVTQDVTSTEPAYTPTVDLPTGSYTWTVRAHDASDNVSQWVTPPYTLTITDGSDNIYLPMIIK
jgi:hypothetical protein